MQATLYYKPRALQPGELTDAFQRAAAFALAQEVEISASYERELGPGRSDDVVLDAEGLRAIIDLSKVALQLQAQRAEKSGPWEVPIYVHVRGDRGLLRISSRGDKGVKCLERLALNLGLEQAEEPKSESWFSNLHRRVLALEEAAEAVQATLRCFISFRFDEPNTAAQVERLKRLLGALRIEWVTGEQFEPRRIEEKVKAKLRADVDFVIAVITKAGESKWIRDEFGDANARGLWVVILLEDGATFDKGIFGTLEYISYDLAIDQTFLGLIEGINFIKAELATRVEHQEDA